MAVDKYTILANLPSSVVDRFWKKVDKQNGPILMHCSRLGRCWQWFGDRNQGGYGSMRLGSSSWAARARAHIISCAIDRNGIPEGSLVLHKCDNPSCVRPSHLWPGSQRENVADMMAKKRDRRPGSRSGVAVNYSRGEDRHNAHCTEAIVLAMRADYIPGVFGCNKIAKKYNVVCRDVVARIIRREIWKHI